jgi:uncharacterized protein YecT (DUF1311 family)
MRRWAAGLAIVLALAGPALAQVSDKQIKARYTPGYGKCMASPGGQSTYGMIDCIGQELKLQDGRLNAAYRKAMNGLTPSEKDHLKAAQRAWVAFRDADCAALEDPQQWGSISRINANQCMLDRTIVRAIELENFPPSNN